MADDAPKPEDHGDHGAWSRLYLTVFVALAVLHAGLVRRQLRRVRRSTTWISKSVSFVIILGRGRGQGGAGRLDLHAPDGSTGASSTS